MAGVAAAPGVVVDAGPASGGGFVGGTGVGAARLMGRQRDRRQPDHTPLPKPPPYTPQPFAVPKTEVGVGRPPVGAGSGR